jgi:hypothetical protein
MDLLQSAARGAAAVGGQVLRAGTGALAALRTADKPLHPGGDVLHGTLTRPGEAAGSPSRWLEEPGIDPVLVRLSRAVGLPAPAPDIFGLALRVPLTDGAHGDVLFASTGLGALTRFTLSAGRTPYSRPMTTLLPYRTPSGPVLLGALFVEPTVVALSWARLRGPWTRFGTIDLPDPPSGEDAAISFDPVLNPLPGLGSYRWVRRLREPAYLTARRSRGHARLDGEAAP